MALFTEEEQDKIAKAIDYAEKSTSGEIRVAIDKHCDGDPYQKATEYFAKLGMDKTALRNGILIYLAHLDKKFAIIGDAGIDSAVPDNFWETTKEVMKDHFKKGNIAEGLLDAIKMAGEKLSKYFPYRAGDINELPNDIVYLDNDKK